MQNFLYPAIRVFQISVNPRFSRTGLDARCGKVSMDSVVTERAFIRRPKIVIDVTAAIGTSLNAVAAAHAALFVDKHHAIRGVEGRSDGTDLCTSGISAMVA